MLHFEENGYVNDCVLNLLVKKFNFFIKLAITYNSSRMIEHQ